MAGIAYVSHPGLYCPASNCRRLVVCVNAVDEFDPNSKSRVSYVPRFISSCISVHHRRDWERALEEDPIPLASYGWGQCASRRFLDQQKLGHEEYYPVWAVWLAELHETEIGSGYIASRKEVKRALALGRDSASFRRAVEMCGRMVESRKERPTAVLGLVRQLLQEDVA
jgi:hypothetical protein